MGQGPAGELGTVGRPVLCPHPWYWAGQAARESVQEKTDTNPDRTSAQAASWPGAGWGKDGIQIQTSLSRSVSGA